MTRDFSGRTLQTEPTLAVNPQDPDHIVLSTIDYNFPSNSVYVSIDGGTSWEGPRQSKYLRDDLGSGGDPVLAFDKNNNVYLTSISIGVEDYGIGSAAGEALVSSIAVATSNDGGFTWNDPVSSARSTIETNVDLTASGRIEGTISFGFLDKPWIAVGPHPTIEDQEMVYVTYTEFVTRYNILYIGDHIYGDILRLKKDCNWRTALVVEELDSELENYVKAQPHSAEIRTLMSRKEPLEHELVELITKRIEASDESEEPKIQELQTKISEIDKTISSLIKKQQSMFNQHWGEIMRAGNEESYFATQVDRYACVYMPKLSDLLAFSPRTYFRAERRPLAHELALGLS